jgi:hypothetical protein
MSGISVFKALASGMWVFIQSGYKFRFRVRHAGRNSGINPPVAFAPLSIYSVASPGFGGHETCGCTIIK